jgi:hypothetical protein
LPVFFGTPRRAQGAAYLREPDDRWGVKAKALHEGAPMGLLDRFRARNPVKPVRQWFASAH